MSNNFKCPNCGKSYYSCSGAIVTSMYYEPVYKDGVNINPDGNIATYTCKCLDCGTEFCVKVQYGEVIDCFITKTVEEVKKEIEELEKAEALSAGESIDINQNTMTSYGVLGGDYFSETYIDSIEINEGIENLIITYKGKKYTFDLGKVLSILGKEVE